MLQHVRCNIGTQVVGDNAVETALDLVALSPAAFPAEGATKGATMQVSDVRSGLLSI